MRIDKEKYTYIINISEGRERYTKYERSIQKLGNSGVNPEKLNSYCKKENRVYRNI
jgi:hypothetical protein